MKDLISNTAFGKLPLEIWMFLPCELVKGKWVVLKEPNPLNYEYNEEEENQFYQDLSEYQEALGNRFFYGFTTGFRIDEHKVFNAGDHIFDENEKIENLLEYKGLKITLTPTALQTIDKLTNNEL